MRFAVDTGGTFTDLLVEDDDGLLHMYKAPTTPADPVAGVLAAFELAAADRGGDARSLLARGDLFIHGTTIATNAILTGRTAKTAFLTTAGHPDILVFREAGRMGLPMFDYGVPYPEPYVPRALTFEVPERIGADGRVLRPLDDGAVLALVPALAAEGVEAVGVCLLWSIVNPRHERRIGELLARHLPGVAVSLSHAVNPSVREYRRASATCIDASLKPLMGEYLEGMSARLRAAGFAGAMMVVTSQGGVMEAGDIARAPIHAVKSGPAMAPVAGRAYAMAEGGADTAIVADAGGTSYDVSLVRRMRIPWTRETWIGPPYRGHMTGFPSVDVRIVGAGGGSIAAVDEAGLLRVGPSSAGAVPGPACYGQGGGHPTVTDAALVLGYLDPDFFLGGRLRLHTAAAADVLRSRVAAPLGLGLDQAAAAVMNVVTENMVGAIEEITINQGIDPRSATLVGGGGAVGLNAVALARRLGCPRVIIPDVAAALSAAGALMSDLAAEFSRLHLTTASQFDRAGVDLVLADLEERCRRFAAGPGARAHATAIDFSVEARYARQIWEIEVPLRGSRVAGPADLDRLIADVHATHREIFAIDDPGSEIEFVTWRARARCTLRAAEVGPLADSAPAMGGAARPAHFERLGRVPAAVVSLAAMAPGVPHAGPLIVESPVTTVVVDPGAVARRTPRGSLVITP
ncbi:MAG: 5-oxoprolinase [Candidatus Rokuibacteriota bacterium]|nr:MAG: 5-oxoprolinase [Candidatus Rokubacteria bacterium]